MKLYSKIRSHTAITKNSCNATQEAQNIQFGLNLTITSPLHFSNVCSNLGNLGSFNKNYIEEKICLFLIV